LTQEERGGALVPDWYPYELPSEDPGLDLGWTDDEIDAAVFFGSLSLGYQHGVVARRTVEDYLRRTGLEPYGRDLDEGIITRDIAVARIVEREYGRRPIYVALTVPGNLGLADRMIQKGIVFEIGDPAGAGDSVDVDAMIRNLGETYLYRGLVLPDGTEDRSLHKDRNTRNLVQNYAAACITAAQELSALRRLGEADEMLNLAQALAPDSAPIRYALAMLSMEMGQWAEAEELLLEFERRGATDQRLYRLLGLMREESGDLSGAAEAYRIGMEKHPRDFDLLRDLFSLLWVRMTDYEGGLEALDLWLERNPTDHEMRQARAAYAESVMILTGMRQEEVRGEN